MIFLIDFDDTLHETKPAPGHRMGKPVPGAVMAMRRLKQERHTLIILTGRRVDREAEYRAVQNWLDYFQVPYDQITNVKPPDYDLVIDNRAIHMDNWAHVMLEIRRLQDRETMQEYTIEGLDL